MLALSFSRMSLDEHGTYKVYLKLSAKTIKSLYKDSDKTQRECFIRVEKFGGLTEIVSANEGQTPVKMSQ